MRPGGIYSPASTLTNRLILEGAKPVLDVRDVLEEVDVYPAAQSQQPLPGLDLELDGVPDENAIFEALAYEPQHIDDLSRGRDCPGPAWP